MRAGGEIVVFRYGNAVRTVVGCGMANERMRLLGAAEALTGAVDGLLPRVRRRAPRQADHLERAAESVLFNSAEVRRHSTRA